jgi:hypothetical protein
MTVTATHVQRGIPPLVLGRNDRAPAVRQSKRGDFLGLAVAAREEEVVELFLRWAHGGVAELWCGGRWTVIRGRYEECDRCKSWEMGLIEKMVATRGKHHVI